MEKVVRFFGARYNTLWSFGQARRNESYLNYYLGVGATVAGAGAGEDENKEAWRNDETEDIFGRRLC